MSSKSIAVPPNLRRPDRDRRAAATVVPEEAPRDPAPEPARLPRTTRAAPAHIYRVGERLRMGNGGYSLARTASMCQVLSLLPYEGQGALLYRVRSDTEQFERIVAEGDLSRSA